MQQAELAVVDHLVFLALAQRLHRQPQLLVQLVHRVVVEVRDPRVDLEHGLRDAQLVLPRRPLVVGEGARQRRLADMARGHLDGRLTVLVLRRNERGPEGLDMLAQRLRPAQHRFVVRTRQRQRGHPRDRPYRVLPLRVRREQRRLAQVVAVGQLSQGRLAAVLAGAEPVQFAVGDQDDPVGGLVLLGEDVAGGELVLGEAVGQRLQRRGVGVVAQRRELPQLGRDHPDFGAGRDELHPAVAERVGEAAVDAVRTAGDLGPGQDAQQPAGGDPLHLRHGLGRGRQLARGRGVQAGTVLLGLGRLRAGGRVHGCGHGESSPVLSVLSAAGCCWVLLGGAECCQVLPVGLPTREGRGNSGRRRCRRLQWPISTSSRTPRASGTRMADE